MLEPPKTRNEHEQAKTKHNQINKEIMKFHKIKLGSMLKFIQFLFGNKNNSAFTEQ